MQYEDVYYSIGQVSEMTGIPQSALRYWETVFDVLDPKKSPGGSRQYLKNDIDIIFKIKDLLYEKAFTIKGANHQLNQTKTDFEVKNTTKVQKKGMDDTDLKENKTKSNVKPDQQAENKLIAKTISELKEILKILE
ncbi:MAG: MerR family transcriptional regulator [Calditrichaceae bacterium]